MEDGPGEDGGASVLEALLWELQLEHFGPALEEQRIDLEDLQNTGPGCAAELTTVCGMPLGDAWRLIGAARALAGGAAATPGRAAPAARPGLLVGIPEMTEAAPADLDDGFSADRILDAEDRRRRPWQRRQRQLSECSSRCSDGSLTPSECGSTPESAAARVAASAAVALQAARKLNQHALAEADAERRRGPGPPSIAASSDAGGDDAARRGEVEEFLAAGRWGGPLPLPEPSDEEGLSSASQHYSGGVGGRNLRNGCNAGVLNRSNQSLRDADLRELLAPDLAGSKDGQKHFEEVDFSQNRITAGGLCFVLELCESPGCGRLRVLKLYRNAIDDQGAQAVADLCSHRPSLEELHLSHNRLTAVGANFIVSAAEAARRGETSSASSSSRPLWLRLEYNRVAEPEVVLQELVARLRVCSGARPCTVRSCRQGCSVHLPYFENQHGEDGGDRRRGDRWPQRSRGGPWGGGGGSGAPGGGGGDALTADAWATYASRSSAAGSLAASPTPSGPPTPSGQGGGYPMGPSTALRYTGPAAPPARGEASKDLRDSIMEAARLLRERQEGGGGSTRGAAAASA